MLHPLSLSRDLTAVTEYYGSCCLLSLDAKKLVELVAHLRNSKSVVYLSFDGYWRLQR